ncbi:hypothetical protein N7528_008979 [Penicillium herquei]|nr:hypothetical protein N7528_008979 [Penicillium herquei]
MPTAKYFSQVPPFPSDRHLVALPKVSLQKLHNTAAEESQLLFEACQNWGFFLLDLQDSEKGKELLGLAEKMFDLANKTFDLDQSVLDSYAYKPPHDLTGRRSTTDESPKYRRYKRKGQLKTDDGKMDRIELYSINQDDILGNRPPRRNADTIEAKRSELRQFIETSNDVIEPQSILTFVDAEIILSCLDHHLGLETRTLSALSPLSEISETSVRLLLSQSQSKPEYDNIALGGHTDIGTITLLFNVIGGLQILPAGKENKVENWLYIKPEPGHAVINIGDTLLEWTGGVLRSSLHRVSTAPGEQALVDRLSVAYLVRPKNSASMRRLKGAAIPPLEENENDETRSVNEWAAWRARQVMLGQLKPQTRGGKLVGV